MSGRLHHWRVSNEDDKEAWDTCISTAVQYCGCFLKIGNGSLFIKNAPNYYILLFYSYK